MSMERRAITERPPRQIVSHIEDARRLVKDGEPLSVLIVEDDKLVSQILSDAVEDYGGRVIGVAGIPAEAFGLLVEHKPHVVVMDIRLKQGADGLHAAESMRALYKTPIVFCTGCGDSDTIWRIRRFGRTECLFKPVRPQELRDAILRAYESPPS
jgi:two-component system, response regulator PdtaR